MQTANVYSIDPSVEYTQEKPVAAFTETEKLAIWLTGLVRQPNWLLPAEKSTIFHLKAVVANVLARLGLSAKDIDFVPAESPLMSQALSVVTRSGKQLGLCGTVAKRHLKHFEIKQEVLYAELDWRVMVKLAAKRSVTYTPLPRTQPVKRDLALLLDAGVTMAQVEKVVRGSEKKLLRSVTLFDVYEGANLQPGKKSYAIAITLQDDEKTLNEHQIEAVMKKITSNLSAQLGAQLR